MNDSALFGTVFVDLPTDARATHGGPHVAGTMWEGCETEPIYGSTAPDFVRGRLAVELRASGLFKNVTMEDTPHDVTLRSRLEVFCSHAEELLFAYYGVIAASALHITLQRRDETVFAAGVMRVVDDLDPEYSGRGADRTVEQARRTIMDDSLRAAIRHLLVELRSRMSVVKSPPQ